MSSIAKIFILFIVLIGIGAGLVVWKNKFGGNHGGQSLNRITKEEMELLLKDANPMMLKRLKDDPEMKKQQIDNLKELLALASQAQKEGLANDAETRKELENIKSELIAVNYDKEINKDKGPMPPFGFITEDQVKAFWEGGAHDADFQQFIDTKINLLKANNPEMKDREISEEEMTQAKDFYAKIQIYKNEYEGKAAKGEVPKELQDKINLQVKLQQASFLARLYSKKLAESTKVTDEDVAKYIAEHPGLDPAAKKTKAEEILNRAKGGEDFAKLANEFSQDPGNKDPKSGELQGGIYKDVPKGRMMPEFEAAALALEPGKVADNLVETPYGYHIIKLEKKTDVKDQSGQPSQTYDVRHILISTGVKDPENPMGREMPVKDYVRTKLESEKEKKVMEDILAKNNVEVAEDFVIPEVSEEQLQKMMQKQMPPGMSPEGGPQGPPPPPPGKGDPKKPAPPKAAPPKGN
ncbi:MAG: peptidyl-prolyl cis-trans isomerase [Pyrinomonadaceae bacterium]|nr:peptidyl-prolyl cis-trans isomerase [Pyrinomonadaceae bacterium]